jgi:hypothetical protein
MLQYTAYLSYRIGTSTVALFPGRRKRQTIKKLLDEGWEARRAAQRAKNAEKSQMTKIWKFRQAERAEHAQKLLQNQSVSEFLKNRKNKS